MWVAILVYAFDEGGTRAVGFVSILCLVPAGLLAPLAAGLGDRFPRERVVRFGYLTQAVVTGILALALVAGAPPIAVYLIAMVSCIPYTAGRPNHHALLPSLSNAPDEVAAANSVSALTEGIGYALGALTAAILAPIGAGAIVAVAAAALGLAFLLTLGIHAPPDKRRPGLLPRVDAGGRRGGRHPADCDDPGNEDPRADRGRTGDRDRGDRRAAGAARDRPARARRFRRGVPHDDPERRAVRRCRCLGSVRNAAAIGWRHPGGGGPVHRRRRAVRPSRRRP